MASVTSSAAGQIFQGNGSGSDPTWTAVPTLGVNGTTAGKLSLANGTGGGAAVTIQNTSATSAYNFNLPATAGTSGQVLLSGGGAGAPMTWGTLSVDAGGTGLTGGISGGIPYFNTATTMASSAALSQHAVVVGGGTGSAPYTLSALGSTGNVLMSAGAGADPAFGALNLAGGSNYVTGTLPVGNGGLGVANPTNHGLIVGQGASATASVTSGAAGQILQGNGASSDPSFTATPTLGVNGTTTGQIALANGAGGGAATTIKPSASTTGAWRQQQI
jgi:hypothetical protein